MSRSRVLTMFATAALGAGLVLAPPGCSGCGRTDNGPCPKWGIDRDGDGAANCPSGCDCAGGIYNDCDDDDPARSFQRPEQCGNGIDDDCDELVDGADPACASDAASDSAASTDATPGYDSAVATDSAPGTDAAGGGTACGPAGLTCDPATEVCVRTTAGPGFSWACSPVPAGCETDHTCACLAPTLCPAPTYACSDSTSTNTIDCDCLPCV